MKRKSLYEKNTNETETPNHLKIKTSYHLQDQRQASKTGIIGLVKKEEDKKQKQKSVLSTELGVAWELPYKNLVKLT